MDRTEALVAVALLLFGAFLMGFLTHWVVTRLSHVSDAELGQLDSMAEELHRAEEERDHARAEHHRLRHEMQAGTGELRSDLAMTREALRVARDEAAELRAYIEAQNMRG
ncbi:hypothetical protein [Mangrovicoccus algicola]|uniref:Uncharacterized protein n=1 Tax=Mangrovicoccus algicola TaxID=2771008 RepID=A0A8J7CUX1_9RHOB|nr:hypothetical protein [Mangrovicoccus algicola]MBE3638069.1 hypothetical protein [Mangrovicoccus algicola]